MAIETKYPIRTKLVLLMAGFVLLATAVYLALAISLFTEDKKQLVYELNASTVKTLAAETEAVLLKNIEKVKLLTQGHRDSHWTRSVFESEPDLIAYSLYAPNQKSQWDKVLSIRNDQYLKMYGLSEAEVDRVRNQIPVPFSEILGKGIWVSNSSLPGGAPILTLGMDIDVVTGGDSLGQYIAIVDLRMDRLIKMLSHRKAAITYLVDGQGNLIAHGDPNLVYQKRSMADVPIVKDAFSSPIKLQLKQFEWEGSQWIGAFSSVGVGGLFIISQVPENQAFKATYVLLQKTILFALLIITVALLVSGWLAGTFTVPIKKLLAATEAVAKGNFEQTIHVNTQDEIAHLSRAFNVMATDLRNQRQQIEAHQSELERKVAERTEALEAEKKKQSEAQETLVRTTRLASLGELAGVAAHEVLNPLNNMNIRIQKISQSLQNQESPDITLMSDIVSSWKTAYTAGGWTALELELGKPSQEAGKSLGQEDLENLSGICGDLNRRIKERLEDMLFLSKEILRITRIVNSMRSLSRVGGERRPIDVHVPLDETVLAIGDQLKKRKIELVKDYSADPREAFALVGDKDELVQVFSNLIRNSAQAVASAKRRVGEIRISTRREGKRIEVRIIDNGTGISEQHVSKLFENNFTTKSLEEGTGLGLSISRRLVRAFGGDLELERTSEGEGTTFLIWFPAAS